MTPLLGFVPLSHARALSGRGPKGSGGRVVIGPAGEQGFVGELAVSRGPAACLVVSSILTDARRADTRLSYSTGAGPPR